MKIKTMDKEIEMKVSQKQSEIIPSDLQMIRRVINVLGEHDFDVELSFKDGDQHDNNDEYLSPYMGGKYPHQGYFTRMVKDTNKRFDVPIIK
jgi:hypothetical protein